MQWLGALWCWMRELAEVLAMVNQPSYNPNNRESIGSGSLRNRAITDVFEPGSTVKPLTMLAAFETGKIFSFHTDRYHSRNLRIGQKRIQDHRDYGVIDVATVVAKSSNVGTSKIALISQVKSFGKCLIGWAWGKRWNGISG